MVLIVAKGFFFKVFGFISQMEIMTMIEELSESL